MFEPEFAGFYHRAPRPFAWFVFILFFMKSSLSIFLTACPGGFLMSGSGKQKDCKKDFDKYQSTKKFVFQT